MAGPHAPYPPEFRREMVELVRSGRLSQELSRLKRENRRLRLEQEILTRAAA